MLVFDVCGYSQSERPTTSGHSSNEIVIYQMCTLVILKRPGHKWPLLLSANRDEMRSRSWSGPARHWQDRPYTIAGLDQLAQGSWLGLNDFGVAAAVLNRHGSLGQAPDKRSRGELVLDALEFSEASDAANSFAELNSEAYRSFNLVIADNVNAYWVTNSNIESRVSINSIPDGLHMLTSHNLDDETSERIKYYLPLFRDADIPQPEINDWKSWRSLLASEKLGNIEDKTSAMCIDGGTDYGTVSSSLIALASPKGRQTKTQADTWHFAPGPPNCNEYRRITLQSI